MTIKVLEQRKDGSRVVEVDTKKDLLTVLALVDDRGWELLLKRKDARPGRWKFPIGWGANNDCYLHPIGKPTARPTVLRRRTIMEAMTWRRKRLDRIMAKVRRTRADELFN